VAGKSVTALLVTPVNESHGDVATAIRLDWQFLVPHAQRGNVLPKETDLDELTKNFSAPEIGDIHTLAGLANHTR
jgi:hypothetical protein